MLGVTRVAACTLARSPIRDPAIRRLQTFRRLHACSGCFRMERFAGWGLHPLESAALSRRTPRAVIHTCLKDWPGGSRADLGFTGFGFPFYVNQVEYSNFRGRAGMLVEHPRAAPIMENLEHVR
jgi:hypothetical protein